MASDQESAAPIKVAAIRVVAMVGDRREERVQQIAVRGVDFRYLEPSLARHPCGGRELPGDVGDLACRQGVRVGGAGMERDRARRDRHPAAVLRRDRLAALPRPRRAGLAPGMRDLDAWHRAAARDDRGEARQQRLVLRVPQAETVMRDAADRGDMGCLGEHDAGAAHRPRAQMLHVPVITQPSSALY